jgi:hypothetical protein
MDHLRLKKTPSRIFPWLTIISFVCLNIVYALPAKSEFQVILHNPTLPFSLRQRLELGSPLYEYIQFILAKTPPNAVIVLPPQQEKFQRYGNVYFMRNFLYPRELLYGENIWPLQKEATYALIVNSISTKDYPDRQLWPKQIDPKNAIYLDDSHDLGLLKLP